MTLGGTAPGREPLGLGLGERRDHVEIERVAGGAGLFRPIEHRQAADGAWECREKRVPREWSIQPDFQHADLLAARGQDVGDLVHGLGTRSHQHDHALGVGIAGVLEQLGSAGPSTRPTSASCARRFRGRRRRSHWRPRAPERTRPGSGRSRAAPADPA